jgi:hypothetical protein
MVYPPPDVSQQPELVGGKEGKDDQKQAQQEVTCGHHDGRGLERAYSSGFAGRKTAVMQQIVKTYQNQKNHQFSSFPEESILIASGHDGRDAE